jgi:Mg/Co/Ni transporter MgtE
MDREDAEEVQELLGYPEDSAGGIMTTDYLSVPEWASIGEIIEAMRARAKAAVMEDDRQAPSVPLTGSQLCYKTNKCSML